MLQQPTVSIQAVCMLITYEGQRHHSILYRKVTNKLYMVVHLLLHSPGE